LTAKFQFASSYSYAAARKNRTVKNNGAAIAARHFILIKRVVFCLRPALNKLFDSTTGV